MPLVLKIKSYHRLAPDQETSKSLDAGRLTIGRGTDNDWTLPDPHKLVSKLHCVIAGADGHYELTDQSKNGVYLNGSLDPVGPDNPVILSAGDRLQIGEYELEVDAIDTDSLSDPPTWSTGMPTSGVITPPAPIADANIGFSDSFATVPPIASDPDSQMLIGLDKPQRLQALPTAPDHGPPMMDHFKPPNAVEIKQPAPPAASMETIPADWDEEWAPITPKNSSPARTPTVAEQEPDLVDTSNMGTGIPIDAAAPTAATLGVNTSISAPGMPLHNTPPAHCSFETATPRADDQSPANPPSTPESSEDAAQKALLAFLEGAGIDPTTFAFGSTPPPDVLKRVGEVYRQMVLGVIDLLAARRSIKNEFRLSQTTIRPQENNPLKFSLGVDDAMLALLADRGAGYMPANAAFEEAFDDIKAHQLAMISGMQLAFQKMMRKLGPDRLQSRVDAERNLTTFLVSRKAQYWDAYVQKYETLVEEVAEDFEDLFGLEFAKAYEEQIDRIRTADTQKRIYGESAGGKTDE
jgi:type VI secretion system protein